MNKLEPPTYWHSPKGKKDEITKLLQKTLAEAKAGKIASIAVITSDGDGVCTSEFRSVSFPDVIGAIEIAKLEWIKLAREAKEAAQ